MIILIGHPGSMALAHALNEAMVSGRIDDSAEIIVGEPADLQRGISPAVGDVLSLTMAAPAAHLERTRRPAREARHRPRDLYRQKGPRP